MSGHILIADNVMSYRVLTRARLLIAHYNVVTANAISDAQGIIEAEAPDLAIIGADQADDAAIKLIQQLKADPKTSSTAILAVSDKGLTAAREAALLAGADDVLERSASEALLLASIRNLMRNRNEDADLKLREETREALGFAEPMASFEKPAGHAKGTIALVAANTQTAEGWKSTLVAQLRDRIEILNPDQLLELDETHIQPDVYVIEADMRHHHDGLSLITDLRSRSAAKGAGIVAVFSPDDEEGAVHALDLGANAVVDTRFTSVELVERIRAQLRRKSRQDQLRQEITDGLQLAVTDPLTGLKNRRYAMSSLARIAESSHRSGQPFAVMMLDLDWFKRVNDEFGHPAGDAVLKDAAQRIANGVRTDDVVARLGGEEFIVVMPDTAPEAAQAAGERLRQTIETVAFEIAGVETPLDLTVSIGIAVAAGGTAAEELIREADRALYSAKSEGRNLVSMGQPAA